MKVRFTFAVQRTKTTTARPEPKQNDILKVCSRCELSAPQTPRPKSIPCRALPWLFPDAPPYRPLLRSQTAPLPLRKIRTVFLRIAPAFPPVPAHVFFPATLDPAPGTRGKPPLPGSCTVPGKSDLAPYPRSPGLGFQKSKR